MNRKCFASLVCSLVFSSCIYAQGNSVVSDHGRVHYLKFSAFPFVYTGLFREQTWLSVHYEGRFNHPRLTYDGVVEYDNYTFRATINITQNVRIPDNVNFWVRPQLRYYFLKGSLNGFYAGVYPLVLYRDIKSDALNGYYFGGGLTFGYQKLIKDKYPVELNFRLSEQSGYVNQPDLNGNPSKIHHSFVFGFVELNLGLARKRHK